MGFPGMTGCHQEGLRPSSKYRGLCRLEQSYPAHHCDTVFPPSITETPPDQHKPTPAPHKSIFHEMMVSKTHQELAQTGALLVIFRETTL